MGSLEDTHVRNQGRFRLPHVSSSRRGALDRLAVVASRDSDEHVQRRLVFLGSTWADVLVVPGQICIDPEFHYLPSVQVLVDTGADMLRRRHLDRANGSSYRHLGVF